MTVQPVLPPALGPGSRIRVIAPASPPKPADLNRGVRALERMGFSVELDGLVRKLRLRGYFSGPEERRARAVNEAFADPDVDGIVCAAGGFGSLRILPHVDYDVIAANPKVFVGFSDITALHVAFQQEAGLVTFHGPTANVESDDEFQGFNEDHFLSAVTRPVPLGRIDAPPDGNLIQVVREGVGTGILTGGNLSLVAATLGTPWEIDTRGKVLFLEEWREPPFTVDTLLTQLMLAGKLSDAAAVVFGEFVDCHPTDRVPNLSIEEVIQELTEGVDVPVLYGVPAGHGRFNATLPFGVRCTVDANAGEFIVDEPAVAARLSPEPARPPRPSRPPRARATSEGAPPA